MHYNKNRCTWTSDNLSWCTAIILTCSSAPLFVVLVHAVICLSFRWLIHFPTSSWCTLFFSVILKVPSCIKYLMLDVLMFPRPLEDSPLLPCYGPIDKFLGLHRCQCSSIAYRAPNRWSYYLLKCGIFTFTSCLCGIRSIDIKCKLLDNNYKLLFSNSNQNEYKTILYTYKYKNVLTILLKSNNIYEYLLLWRNYGIWFDFTKPM